MPPIILCLLSGVGGYILGQFSVRSAANLGPQITGGPHGGHHGHGGHGGHGHGHGGHLPLTVGPWGEYNEIDIYNDSVITQDPLCSNYAYHDGQLAVITNNVKHHPACPNLR